MPRRNQSNSRFRPRFRRRRRPNNLQSQIVRSSFQDASFFLQQVSSGTGTLTTLNSGASLTAVSQVNLDPFNIGGRFNVFASQFTKYRIRRMVVRYVPSLTTSSGVEETVTGGSSAPVYGSRGFCWTLALDPFLSLPTSGAILEYGGRACNTARFSSLAVTIRDPTWYYTSTTSASPTSIDLRMSCPLQLISRFVSTSTTSTMTFGHVILNFIAEFQGPIATQTTIGLQVLPEQRSESKEDSDDLHIANLNLEDSPVLVRPQSSTPKLKISLSSQK